MHVRIYTYMYSCMHTSCADARMCGWKGQEWQEFPYVAWLMPMWHASCMCDMTRVCVTWHVYVWHDTCMCDMTLVCVTWHLYVRHDSSFNQFWKRKYVQVKMATLATGPRPHSPTSPGGVDIYVYICIYACMWVYLWGYGLYFYVYCMNVCMNTNIY